MSELITDDEVITESGISRLIGRIEGSDEGQSPTLIAVGGIHGNEPAGVQALEQAIALLEDKKAAFRGTFIAVRGNLKALKQGVRFIDEDMNRIWFPSIIDKIRRTPIEEIDCAERREIKQLLEILDYYYGEKQSGKVIFVDLHTFSAPGCLFALCPRNSEHIQLLKQVGIPLIFGIENTLQGTTLKYIQDSGDVAFGIEGGQHHDEQAVENHLASLLILLETLGCISEQDMPQISHYRSLLKEETKNLPNDVDLVYQHIVEPEDEFRMCPGFKNFQKIEKGEWLASDRNGKIEAQSNGYILMPLYQDQGNDGFFIVQEQK